MTPIYMKHPYFIDIKGNDYLTVPGRLLMFRADMEANQLNGEIPTEVIAVGELIVVKASVYIDGNLQATGHATVRSGQGQKWQGREVEKAETAAIGRALAHAGYGTQFALADMEEGEFLADSPIENVSTSPADITKRRNFIKADKDIRKRYEADKYLKNVMELFEGETGYKWHERTKEEVKTHLVNRPSSSKETVMTSDEIPMGGV